MKWLRTLVLFNKGNVMSSEGWNTIHETYREAIKRMEHPPGAGKMILRPKARKPDSSKYWRNGVPYLREHFLRNMLDLGWSSEGDVNLGQDRQQPEIVLFPSLESYREPLDAEFGGFDFVKTTEDGLKVAIEWETGNISSSHRSMNKLALALKAGIIDAGVLIVPSRSLYAHLTDRTGNISELSGYLELWESVKDTVESGLLAITVVEHDELARPDDESVPYLETGEDGRAAEGRRNELKEAASKAMKTPRAKSTKK